MNQQIYNHDDLVGFNDEDLFIILMGTWGIEENEIDVWGELPTLESSFGFLRNVYLVTTGERPYYPLKGIENKPCKFFVAPQDARKFGSSEFPRYIRCKLELSPASEREKHKNPFLLCVKPGSCESLQRLPKEIPVELFTAGQDDSNEDKLRQFIAKSIYDFHRGNVVEELTAHFNETNETRQNELDEKFNKTNESILLANKQLIELDANKRNIIDLINKLNGKRDKLTGIINELSEQRQLTKDKIDRMVADFEKIEKNMENKVKRLKQYVSEKAEFLQTFELVDDDNLTNFISEPKKQKQSVDGISFRDDMSGDYNQAVSYIQSYLVNADVLYPRHIIENFITLLRTKDLIILAGDSGSGKTNLVKSFAKAVGGKSIIVPVKPNWTSSDDLLGYYNPLEKKYLATPFLDALLEAEQNPEIPYFICLDEMNLARVEYYFADFLSLLETRDEDPEIILYSQDESSHVLSELKTVVEIIQSTKEKYSRNGVVNFIDLLKDEDLNSQLRLAFGFSDKESLIKYHSEIRRILASVMTMPASIKMPANVHIIGAINIDETTHYLSPKILDRAHIMRFESPLLSDWDEILQEVDAYDLPDTSKPLLFDIEELGYRHNYPKFDRNNEFCQLFVELNRDYFHKLGVEFGMRTIRQGLNYIELYKDVNKDYEQAINNFLIHKVLPKLTFDGNKSIDNTSKLDLLERVLIERLKTELPSHERFNEIFSAIYGLESVVKNAKSNDGIVNFWA